MGAAPDAYAAFYVSHRGITLAMDPQQVRLLADWAGLPIVAKNETTHYLKCPALRLTDASFFDRVLEAAQSAILRSWRGPRWERFGEGGTPAAISARCPIHSYELAANGFCMGCDDIAPAL